MRGVGTFSVDLTVAWQWRENDTVGHIRTESAGVSGNGELVVPEFELMM